MSYYDDASLVLIPSGVKTSKVYSQKPTDGSGDFTFSRASTATRTNASGVIESVASNVPRLDYSGGATCPRLLLEGQRSNLVFRSEEFENGYWTTSALNVSVSSNVVTAPDGTNTADLIVANAITSNVIYVRNSMTLPSTGTYTFSVYAKKQNQNTIGLRSISSGTLINYDLDAETSTGGFIQNVGGGWFRIGFSYTAASTSESIYIYPLGTGTRTGNGVDGVYVWGAQLEAGSFVSSYIPTTTAAVTRLADLCSKTSINSLIGQTEGTMFFGFNLTRYNDTKTLGSIDVGDITNFITITINAGIPRLTVRQSGSSTNLFMSTQLAFGNHKLAVGYKSGDYVMYINGTQVGTSSSTIYPVGTLTRYVLGNSSYGELADSYNQAALFPTRLTNAQLAELTTL